MSLQSDIAAIPKLDDYKGGIASVRTHQNKEVAAINAIIDAANNNPAGGAGAGDQTLVMTILANGTPLDVVFTAYVATQ